MDRRIFLRNTGLAVVLSGFSPSFAINDLNPFENRKIHFILRSVGYTDALRAFANYTPALKGNFSFRKVVCENPGFTHEHGINTLMGFDTTPVLPSQEMERHTIGQVVKDAFSPDAKHTYVHIHHTEIGHSSEEDYKQRLDEFFAAIAMHYEVGKHTVIITADIGRNEAHNSCGGRDHSDPSSLETFALYLGKDIAEAAIQHPALTQKMVFSV